jgi:signal transduction histidine kinase
MSNTILSKARVLIVDDESSNVRLLERILEMFGCREVRSTTDSREALGIYLEMQPDIILLDLHMPHLDGFALMQQFGQVVAADSYVPILVLTADITVDTKRRALASGAKDLVTKPIDHSEVILRIKNLLENRFLHLQLQQQNGVLEETVKTRTAQLEETLAELKSAQESVVRQERLSALGMMAGGIAHDFNNALTMVLGYSELLLPYLQDHAPKKERDYIHNVINAAQDATHVVARLRDFYRPADNNEIRVGVSLNDVVTQTVSLTAPKWSSQKLADGVQVRVVSVLEEEVPPVLASAAELREALTNLIFNAVDAMPEGGEIKISTQSDGDDVMLLVSDSGIGMTDEERERCLEPFFSTKGARGTGLGLAVVYGIIHRHGGTIDIISEKFKGTTFRIRLPSTTADTAAAPAPAVEIDRSLRILVVDDQEIICELIGEYLRADGHEPVTTIGAPQALELLRTEKFDLLITDQSMPEINGVQLAISSKSLAPATPVILLTGFGDEMQAAGTCPSEIDLILSKPVSMAGLRHAVFTVVPHGAGHAPEAAAELIESAEVHAFA